MTRHANTDTAKRMKALWAATVCGLVLWAAGCDNRRPEEPGQPVNKKTDGSIPVVIPQTDLLGRFTGNVHDIAFWHHGAEPFRGGVIAGNGPAGLVLVTMEGQANSPAAGNFSGEIAITYLARGTGADARTADPDRPRQISLIAAYDTGTGNTGTGDIGTGNEGTGNEGTGNEGTGSTKSEDMGTDAPAATGSETDQTGLMRFFTINEDDNSFLELTLPGMDHLSRMPPPAAFCFSSRKDQNTHTLVVIEASGIARQIHITLDDTDDLSVTEGLEFRLDNARSCAGDLHDGTLYVASGSGEIEAISGLGPGTEMEPKIQRRARLTDPVVDIGVMLITSPAGERKSAILALTRNVDAGPGHMLDARTGEEIGRFTLGAFDEIGALTEAAGFAVGSGNLGGLYRRGAIAVIDAGEGGALKLAPLSPLLTNAAPLLAGDAITPRNALLGAAEQPIGPPTRLLPDGISITPPNLDLE